MSAGRLRVIGLGPGPADWRTPEADAALARASDNREEISRARRALALAAEGADVALVSGGDPGIFAMAAALIEAVEAGEPAWRGLDIEVLPGVSAMQAAAARLGAPLGHDFCAISLSDNLKPWDVVARRLSCAAEGDFVVALYNPASKARPQRIHDAFTLLRSLKAGSTPVAFARAVGGAYEKLTLTNLHDADPGVADMATLVMIGSSETRWVAREGARPWMLTPRSYGAGR